MGCRTRVIGNTWDPNNEITAGRGNLSFSTLNLPRLGIEAHGDIDKFFKDLDNITDEIVAAAILKSKKMCQDQIDTCPANRPDRLEAYNLCMTYINEFAPKMMSEEEICEFVKNEIVQFSINNRDDKFNKGAFMKIIMPKLKGKADGKLINKIVTDILSKQG
jgi:anaerobic ribonucleoside-triphosphate reductase